jgi:hypothetical protein
MQIEIRKTEQERKKALGFLNEFGEKPGNTIMWMRHKEDFDVADDRLQKLKSLHETEVKIANLEQNVHNHHELRRLGISSSEELRNTLEVSRQERLFLLKKLYPDNYGRPVDIVPVGERMRSGTRDAQIGRRPIEELVAPHLPDNPPPMAAPATQVQNESHPVFDPALATSSGLFRL